MNFVIGVDIGRRGRQEYTAIALVEQWINMKRDGWLSYWQADAQTRARWYERGYETHFDWNTKTYRSVGPKYIYRGSQSRPHVNVRYLDRFVIETNYIELSKRLASLREHLHSIVPKADVHLIMHEGLVGKQTVDMVLDNIDTQTLGRAPFASVQNVLISDGLAETFVGGRKIIPRSTLLSGLNALLDDDPLRLHFDENTAASKVARQLVREMQSVQLRAPAANDEIVGRERDTDDLVFATALACWVIAEGLTGPLIRVSSYL